MTEFLPLPRKTVQDVVDSYNAAVARYELAYTALSSASELLADANSAAIECSPGINEYNFKHIHEILGMNKTAFPKADEFRKTAIRVLTINCWAWIIKNTRLESILDHDAKEKLRAALQFTQEKNRRSSWSQELVTENDASIGMPEITVENIMATLEHYAANGPDMMARGIATVFAKLDRRFKSHDAFKVGSRIIMTNVFNSWGSFTYGPVRDLLIDVERVFSVLDGHSDRSFTSGIQAIEESRRGKGMNPAQSYVETEYFRFRGFQNGNCHVWFRRDDLVEKVNAILGKYYGEVLPDDTDGSREEDPLKNPKREMAKNFGFFPSPKYVVERVLEQAQINTDKMLRILEPSAGTGSIAYAAVGPHVKRDWQTDKTTYTSHSVEVVEIQPELADALTRSNKFSLVMSWDFLDVPVKAEFDRVLMNPPFDRERDIDHVMHASKFLKPGGRLVAVMSAGTRVRETKKTLAFHKYITDNFRVSWEDLPERSFSETGTNVNTTILILNTK